MLAGMDLDRLIDRYRSTRERTLARFATPAANLARTYAPGKWSVRRILVHLSDAETVLFARVRRCIAEDRPSMAGFDQDLWVTTLDYDTCDLAVSREVYAATRAAVISFATRFGPTCAGRTYHHSEAGERTLAQELEKIAAHNESHLVQIDRALA